MAGTGKYMAFTSSLPLPTGVIRTYRNCQIGVYVRELQHVHVLLGKKAVARETMMLTSEYKSRLVDAMNDSAADGKTKSRA